MAFANKWRQRENLLAERSEASRTFFWRILVSFSSPACARQDSHQTTDAEVRLIRINKMVGVQGRRALGSIALKTRIYSVGFATLAVASAGLAQGTLPTPFQSLSAVPNPQSPSMAPQSLFGFQLPGDLALQVPSGATPPALPEDPTLPLRRFPFSIEVKRQGAGDDAISILHVVSLHPKDQLFLKIAPDAKGDYTFVEAMVGAAQKIKVKTWNLWDKKKVGDEIDLGPVPDDDVVPLFFLVLNAKHDRIEDAVIHSLQTSSQPIISECATFETCYQQQNRLLNFMTAYAELGPKATADPVVLQDRVNLINADLGIAYDLNPTTTQPGYLQQGLDAGYGLLNVIRQTPDNPAATAIIAQQQLPSLVSDWVGLICDLGRIFFRPPKEVKLCFIPASASQAVDAVGDTNGSMQLLTERVAETTDGSLPTLVYRPLYDRHSSDKPMVFGFERQEVLANDATITIPFSSESRDLYLHPWAWDWQMSTDGKNFLKIINPRIVPGSGLVIPIPVGWWGNASEKKIFLKFRLNFRQMGPIAVRVAKVYGQSWACADPAPGPELTAGDSSAGVLLNRSGHDQSFYRIESVEIKDSAGKIYKAQDVAFNGQLNARFSLAPVAPGPAQVSVMQEGDIAPDPPVNVFVAPKHPDVAIYCGKEDAVLRIAGGDASWVKSVAVPSLTVKSVDDAEPNNRLWTLSGNIPPDLTHIQVSFRDPSNGLEWSRTMPLVIGLPRPHANATLLGNLPDTVAIGAGPDPLWATAAMPAGWFSTKEPIRVQLSAVTPFAWSHDVGLDLGLGSAGDVQKIVTVPEGQEFAMDERSPTAMMTMTLDPGLPKDAKRSTGLVWIKLNRTDLSSPWTLATQADGSPLRAVKLPVVFACDYSSTRTRITLGDADQVVGVRFGADKDWVTPTLSESVAPNLVATVDGPPKATEFDLQLRDASDGFIRVKIVRQTGDQNPPH